MRTLLKWVQVTIVSILVTTAVWTTWSYHGYPKGGIDDANIFFVYADNLSTGHGFVYNQGGERIEGVTSLSWVLLCTGVFYVGQDEHMILAICVVLLIAVQVIFLEIIRRESNTRGIRSWPYEFLYLALLLSSPAYLTWMSITLMDMCLWGFVITGAVFMVLYPPTSLPQKIGSGLILSTMLLVRPEGLMIAPALILVLGVRMYTLQQPRIFRTLLGHVIGYAGVLGTVTVFRLCYFGYPLPNTFYAKVSPSLRYNLQEGEKYFRLFFHNSFIVSCGVLMALMSLAWFLVPSIQRFLRRTASRRQERLVATTDEMLSCIAVLLLKTPVLTGGDHFRMFRFYQPVYPLLCVIIVLFLQRIRLLSTVSKTCRNLSNRAISVCLFGLAVPGIFWLWAYAHDTGWNALRRDGSPLQHEFAIVEGGRAGGIKLTRLFDGHEPLPSLGVIISGGIKRTYSGHVMDLMGLNSTLMGHSKGERKGFKNHAAFEPTVFFALQPDILVASLPVPPETRNLSSVCLKGLFDDSTFQDMYAYGQLRPRMTGRTQYALQAFIKKEFLRHLVMSGNWDFLEDKNWLAHWVKRSGAPLLEDRDRGLLP